MTPSENTRRLQLLTVSGGLLLLGCWESTEVLGAGETGTTSVGGAPSPLEEPGDVGKEAGGGGGAGPVPWEPFGAPRVVDLGDPMRAEDDPSLSADGLELYFDSGNLDTADIWRAARPSLDSDWTDVGPVDALNSTLRDTTPTFSPDGLTLYLASERGGAELDIYVSHRNSREASWTEPQLVPELNSEREDLAPHLSWDGNFLILTRSDPENYRSSDLWLTRVQEGGSFAAPLPIPEASQTDFPEANGILTSNGLVLLYSHGTEGRSADLVIRERPSLNAPFGPARPLDELNSVEEDTDPWLSEDGNHILFSSRRDGVRKIYEAFR